MMRIPASTAVAASIAVTAAMLVMAPATVQAQTEQEWDSCYGIGVSTNFQPPEILISGCTAVIQSGIHSGRNLVVAFTNRGLGYRGTFQYESAFADFDQAIGLDSNYLPAYHQRGSLYWERGDFERARQDLDQIVRLQRLEAEPGAEELRPDEASDRRREAGAIMGDAD
jgi:tetratricopeptide (TPR) repeat protein